MPGSNAILLAEADLSARTEITNLLNSSGGFTLIATGDGSEAKLLAGRYPFDLAILNVELPGMSGIEICREIHEETRIPVILTSTAENEANILAGLEAGADDFLVLPLRPVELLARVHMVLKRAAAQPGDMLCYADLLLDLRSNQVVKDGVAIPLTRTELRLLACFMRSPGQTISKDALLQEVWGYKNMIGDYNIVDTAIRRLRNSIGDDPKTPRYIYTVWGRGYRFGE